LPINKPSLPALERIKQRLQADAPTANNSDAATLPVFHSLSNYFGTDSVMDVKTDVFVLTSIALEIISGLGWLAWGMMRKPRAISQDELALANFEQGAQFVMMQQTFAAMATAMQQMGAIPPQAAPPQAYPQKNNLTESPVMHETAGGKTEAFAQYQEPIAGNVEGFTESPAGLSADSKQGEPLPMESGEVLDVPVGDSSSNKATPKPLDYETAKDIAYSETLGHEELAAAEGIDDAIREALRLSAEIAAGVPKRDSVLALKSSDVLTPTWGNSRAIGGNYACQHCGDVYEARAMFDRHCSTCRADRVQAYLETHQATVQDDEVQPVPIDGKRAVGGNYPCASCGGTYTARTTWHKYCEPCRTSRVKDAAAKGKA